MTAAAHKPARVVYHLMRHGAAYVKQTEEAYADQVRGRAEKAFHRRAKELAYEVRKGELPESPVVAGPAVAATG